MKRIGAFITKLVILLVPLVFIRYISFEIVKRLKPRYAKADR